MPAIFDYARPRRTPKQWATLCVEIIFRIAMWSLLGLALMTILTLLTRGPHAVVPGSAPHFWSMLTNGSASVVARDSDTIVYVWRGRDHHMYLQTTATAVAAEADSAAQSYVQRLLRWQRDGALTGNQAIDLRALTGQDFGTNPTAWDAWADAHLSEVKSGEATWRNVMALESKAAPRSPPGEYNYKDPLFVEAYWQEAYKHDVLNIGWRLAQALKLFLLATFPLAALTWEARRLRHQCKTAHIWPSC